MTQPQQPQPAAPAQQEAPAPPQQSASTDTSAQTAPAPAEQTAVTPQSAPPPSNRDPSEGLPEGVSVERALGPGGRGDINDPGAMPRVDEKTGEVVADVPTPESEEQA